MAKKPFVDVEGAGDRQDYAAILKQIIKDGGCPFCPQNFKYHTRPILRDGKYWLVTENFAPYTGTKNHFLFLLKKHTEHVTDIPPAAWPELLEMLKWTSKKYKLPAGSFFMRFGDMRYTGASVAHLHAQLILGTRRTKRTHPIGPLLGHTTKPYIPPKNP